MNINKFLIVFLFCVGSFFAFGQRDSVIARPLNQYPEELIQTDDFGYKFYYDEKQKARIYEINGETVVVMDEITIPNKPRFNNELDKNYYSFINKKLNRVYPLFLTALGHYRSLQTELNQLSGSERKKVAKQRQTQLASVYEKQLRDLTTTEGQVFAKLMNRATGKTVFEIIKELRGGWSAFWWNVKGNIAEVDLKEPYDPHKNRTDTFLEHLLQANWDQGYLAPYPGYRDFKVSK